VIFVGLATVALGALVAHAQERTPAPASSKGVNVGSLSCNVAGGTGLVFGSTKALNCIFTRTEGSSERYVGEVKRFGVDIGYTQEAQIVWLVFAPGSVAPGALAGGYAGPTVQAAVAIGGGSSLLVGGNDRQVTLQPVSVEGSVGFNVAGGMAEIVLKPVR
jgi:hypothetical protein